MVPSRTDIPIMRKRSTAWASLYPACNRHATPHTTVTTLQHCAVDHGVTPLLTLRCNGQAAAAAKALRSALHLGLPPRLVPCAWVQLGLSLFHTGDISGSTAARAQVDRVVVGHYNARRRKESYRKLSEYAVEHAARRAVKILYNEQSMSRSPRDAMSTSAPPKTVEEMLRGIEACVAREEAEVRQVTPPAVPPCCPLPETGSPVSCCLFPHFQAEFDALVDGPAKSPRSHLGNTAAGKETSFEWNDEFVGQLAAWEAAPSPAAESVSPYTCPLTQHYHGHGTSSSHPDDPSPPSPPSQPPVPGAAGGTSPRAAIQCLLDKVALPSHRIHRSHRRQ